MLKSIATSIGYVVLAAFTVCVVLSMTNHLVVNPNPVEYGAIYAHCYTPGSSCYKTDLFNQHLYFVMK